MAKLNFSVLISYPALRQGVSSAGQDWLTDWLTGGRTVTTCDKWRRGGALITLSRDNYSNRVCRGCTELSKPLSGTRIMCDWRAVRAPLQSASWLIMYTHTRVCKDCSSEWQRPNNYRQLLRGCRNGVIERVYEMGIFYWTSDVSDRLLKETRWKPQNAS